MENVFVYYYFQTSSPYTTRIILECQGSTTCQYKLSTLVCQLYFFLAFVLLVQNRLKQTAPPLLSFKLLSSGPFLLSRSQNWCMRFLFASFIAISYFGRIQYRAQVNCCQLRAFLDAERIRKKSTRRATSATS